MSDDKIIDMRSGRGKAERSAAEEEQQRQAAALAAQREAFMGPQVTLTFPNEYMFDVWRSGVVNDGKRMMAHRITQELDSADAEKYNALVLQLGQLLGAPAGPNMVSLQNTVRRFLGIPEAGSAA